jgi:hypothetical protein
MAPICYLCCEPITNDRTDDHVPPKQLFAPQIRRTHNLDRLATLPAHGRCNQSYSRDEEYFVATLAPIALGSPSANAVVAHHAEKVRAGRSVPLSMRVLQQFTDRPGGLYLPRGLVAMRAQGSRITRVVWKIVRGLYTLEKQQLLPEPTPFTLELMEPENPDPPRHPEMWEAVKAQPGKGPYAAVFDYKYLHAVKGEMQVHAWGMLFWDRIMIFAGHLHPTARPAAAT